MKKILFVDVEKCSGCRICENACSFKHDGVFRPSAARISVASLRKECVHIPVICTQCTKPMCKEVCPAGAISQDAKTGAWVVDARKCIGCRKCNAACPLGAASFDAAKGVSFKCDLCEGEPSCAKYCPMEAVRFIDEDRAAIQRRGDVALKLFDAITGAV